MATSCSTLRLLDGDVIRAAGLLLRRILRGVGNLAVRVGVGVGLVGALLRHILVRVLLRLGDVVLDLGRRLGLVAAGESDQRGGREYAEEFRVHAVHLSGH